MSDAPAVPLVLADDPADRPGVRLLTLNRPQALNAFDSPLYRAAGTALDAARADDTVKVVVVTGAGRAFSSGQDLEEMARLAAGEATDSGFPVLLEALQGFDKPLVAAVNGAAVGIGFTMLPHCDIVVAAESARFRTPFAEMGVPPEAASSLLFQEPSGSGPCVWMCSCRFAASTNSVTTKGGSADGSASRTRANPGPSTRRSMSISRANRVRKPSWSTR